MHRPEAVVGAAHLATEQRVRTVGYPVRPLRICERSELLICLRLEARPGPAQGRNGRRRPFGYRG
jgi:hypothetical protein